MLSRILALCAVLSLTSIVAAEDGTGKRRPPAPQRPAPRIIRDLQQVGDSDVPHIVRDSEIQLATDNLIAGLPPEKQAIVEQKLQDIDKLQAEIEQIRTESGANLQILLRIAVLKVSLAKMQALGVDPFAPPAGVSAPRNPQPTSILGTSELVALQVNLEKQSTKVGPASLSDDPIRFIDLLLENDAAEIVARPNLVVTNRRPASMQIGDEIPEYTHNGSKHRMELQVIGTDLNVVATKHGNGILQLDLRVRVSERDKLAVAAGKESGSPPLKVRQTDTSVTMKNRQPVALIGFAEEQTDALAAGQGKKREARDQTALMIVVLPEEIDALNAQ